MPYDISPTLKAMLSQFRASGYFDDATIGEPKGPLMNQGQSFIGSVIPHNWAIAQIMLDGSLVELHTVIVRVWCDMLAEPQDDYELRMAELIGRIVTDLLGEFTLGGTVRSVDFAGINGARMEAKWGYIDLSGTKYRIVDLFVPLLVDNGGNNVSP